MVVPRTTGCHLKTPDNVDPEFIKLMDIYGSFHPLFDSTLNDIFTKFDLMISNTIDFKEFSGFLNIIGR